MDTSPLPDFAVADDATLQRFLPSLDGRWSEQTREILRALGSTRLELNANWAGVAADWRCPVCRRRKPEIARLTSAGVVLCQLDRHHDHLADEGVRILWRGQQKPTERARIDALHSAVQACMALAERFHTVLVCNDCNAADGAAKLALAGEIDPNFSFAPSEIVRFINVAPNMTHVVDVLTALAVWREVAEDVRDRLAFMRVMAGRIAEGRHAREGSSYRPDPKATLMTDVLGAAFGDRWRAEWLPGVVAKRSIQRDGFASSAKPAGKARVAVPTMQDLERFTAAARPGDFWHAPPADWCCGVCDRSRLEMLRKAPKSGLWTAGAHRRRVFSVEMRPEALWARNGWYDPGLTYGDFEYMWVCKDCRQIITDAHSTGQNLIDDCLSVADLRALLISARPHERPEYDRQAAAALAQSNREMMAAVESFDEHRRRCLNLFHQRRHLIRFHAEGVVDEHQIAEIEDDHIDEAGRRGHLAWLLVEGKRFSDANVRDKWPRDEVAS